MKAPLVDERYASFERRLFDDRIVDEYGFFIWEIVRPHVAQMDGPPTLHYRGQGSFMVAGTEVDFRRHFRPEK